MYLSVALSIHIGVWLLNPGDIFYGTKAGGQLGAEGLRVTINLVYNRIN